MHHCIALLGMGASASPIEVDIASIQDIDIEMPTWVELGGVEGDAEAFLQLKVSKEVVINDKLKGKNMIAVLLILAEAFFISPKKDPTSIGLTFLKVMSEFTTKHGEDEEQEKFSETFMHAIQFCWSTANKLLPLPSPMVSWNPCSLQTGVPFYTGMQSRHALMIKLWTCWAKQTR